MFDTFRPWFKWFCLDLDTALFLLWPWHNMVNLYVEEKSIPMSSGAIAFAFFFWVFPIGAERSQELNLSGFFNVFFSKSRFGFYLLRLLLTSQIFVLFCFLLLAKTLKKKKQKNNLTRSHRGKTQELNRADRSGGVLFFDNY